MANKTPTKTTLKKGDKLPNRGKGKKSLMLEAIRTVCKSEQEFLQKVVTIGLGDALNEVAPNPTLLTLVLNRIEPPLKPVSPMIEFEFNIDDKPHEQALQIINESAKGLIPPDVAKMFVECVSSMLKIQEITDIDERLKLMEKKIDETD